MVDGGEIMAGRGWWRQNYGWSWVVVGDEFKIMTSRGWSWVVAAKLWVVVDGRGWSHDSVMSIIEKPWQNMLHDKTTPFPKFRILNTLTYLAWGGI